MVFKDITLGEISLGVSLGGEEEISNLPNFQQLSKIKTKITPSPDHQRLKKKKKKSWAYLHVRQGEIH